MAELDLYGDLYGDVDDCGSPVALSPSQPAAAPAPEKQQPSSSSAKRSSRPPSPSPRNEHPKPNHPTTFSISTYEDPSYSKKKHESPRRSGHDLWQADSSHASRPPPPAHSSTSAAGTAGRPGLWGVKPSEMPDEGKMFVGGLNWETTEDALKHYFAQFGAVVHCTIMRDPTNGRSRGFAFLTFADPAVVNKVMVKEHFLDGKLIDPKRAIPRGTAPAGISGASMSDKHSGHHYGSENSTALSNKLFCRGMPDDATPQSFRAYWAQFDSRANIEEAVLMMDRDSNRHRGFGFVNLVSGEDADALLKCGPFVMDGHPLEVKKKAPSRARYDSRDDLNKMPPPPLDRYGAPFHHDPGYHSGPMSGYYKGGGMGGLGGWKGWSSSMLPPMNAGRGMYMGMGMHHDDRQMSSSRGMAHDVSGGMVGPYGGSYQRSGGGYGADWRGGGPPSMRPGSNGQYSSYHHSNAPVGPSRSQRGSRNYTPY